MKHKEHYPIPLQNNNSLSARMVKQQVNKCLCYKLILINMNKVIRVNLIVIIKVHHKDKHYRHLLIYKLQELLVDN